MSEPMKVEKAIEISDAKIQFVSLVNKAANKRQFLITKADDGQAQFSTVGKVLKTDNDTHYVTGVVYEPLVADAHDNFMTESEIRKAAHWFAKNGNKVDLQHNFEPLGGATVVESYITPDNITVGGQPVVKGTWVMTVEVENDDIWNKIQKGEITGFSMGGVGKYAEADTELSEAAQKRGLFKRLAELFGFGIVEKDTTDTENEPIEKAGKKISGKNRSTLQSIYDNLGGLLNDLADGEKEENEMTRNEIIDLVNESVQKAFDKEKPVTKAEEPKAEPQLTKEEVQTIVDSAVQKAFEAQEPSVTPEMVQSMVKGAVQTAVEPILKARSLSSNLGNEQPVVKNDNQHYLAGVL